MRGKEKRGHKGGEERSCYSVPACRFRGQCDGFTSALTRESFVPIHWNSLRSRVLLVQLVHFGGKKTGEKVQTATESWWTVS